MKKIFKSLTPFIDQKIIDDYFEQILSKEINKEVIEKDYDFRVALSKLFNSFTNISGSDLAGPVREFYNLLDYNFWVENEIKTNKNYRKNRKNEVSSFNYDDFLQENNNLLINSFNVFAKNKNLIYEVLDNFNKINPLASNHYDSVLNLVNFYETYKKKNSNNRYFNAGFYYNEAIRQIITKTINSPVKNEICRANFNSFIDKVKKLENFASDEFIFEHLDKTGLENYFTYINSLNSVYRDNQKKIIFEYLQRSFKSKTMEYTETVRLALGLEEKEFYKNFEKSLLSSMISAKLAKILIKNVDIGFLNEYAGLIYDSMEKSNKGLLPDLLKQIGLSAKNESESVQFRIISQFFILNRNVEVLELINNYALTPPSVEFFNYYAQEVSDLPEFRSTYKFRIDDERKKNVLELLFSLNEAIILKSIDTTKKNENKIKVRL